MFVVSLLGWSFIPMIMSAHVSFVIAGTVPVGDMLLLASTNQKAYAAFISRQWKNMCSTVSRLIPQRGQLQQGWHSAHARSLFRSRVDKNHMHLESTSPNRYRRRVTPQSFHNWRTADGYCRTIIAEWSKGRSNGPCETAALWLSSKHHGLLLHDSPKCENSSYRLIRSKLFQDARSSA